MCRLRNIAMHDFRESVTTGQTGGQSDPYVPICFAGDTKSWMELQRDKQTDRHLSTRFPSRSFMLGAYN